jgi:hypothetical protein
MDRTNGKADTPQTRVGLRYVREWQPINTAPKMDGREVLVLYQSGHMAIVHFDQHSWSHYATRGILHYMELPEPPERDADKDVPARG